MTPPAAPTADKTWDDTFPDSGTRNEWRRAFPDVASAREWDTAFNPGDAYEWDTIGTAPDDAREWDARGLDPDTVYRLGWQTLSPTESMDRWTAAGFALADTIRWIDIARITDPDNAADLQEALTGDGAALEAIRVCIDSGWDEGDLVVRVSGRGTLPPCAPTPSGNDADLEAVAAAFDPQSEWAWEWAFPSEEERSIWRSVWRRDAAESRRWATRRIGPHSAVEWSDLDFDADEADRWRRAGTDPSNAWQWRSNGLEPTDAAVWSGERDNGDASEPGKGERQSVHHEVALSWHLSGISPKQRLDWLAHTSVTRAHHAAVFADVGLTPRTIKALTMDGWSLDKIETLIVAVAQLTE